MRRFAEVLLDIVTIGLIPFPWKWACRARAVKRFGKVAVFECPHPGEKREFVCEYYVDGSLVKRVVFRCCKDCAGGLG